MKYLVAVDRLFADAPGGAYRVAWDLACFMRAEGHDVALLCGDLDAAPTRYGRSYHEGIEIVRYPIRSTSLGSVFSPMFRLQRATDYAKRLLGDRHWDIVHGHTPLTALAAFLFTARTSRKMYTIHSPAGDEYRLNSSGWRAALGSMAMAYCERIVCTRAHSLHTLSRFTLEAVRASHGRHIANKVTVIPGWCHSNHSLSDRASRRLAHRAHLKTIFTIRRLVPRMGLDQLIRAANEIAPSQQFQLVIAGDGPERQVLKQLASRSPVPDRILFLGRITDAELDDWYAAADLVVVPSVTLECFGLVAIEALTHGRPVIVSDTGGLPEIVRPIAPHCVYPANDVQALKQRLERFLNGELELPTEAALQQYADSMFSSAAVLPQYRAWLTPGAIGA